MKKLILLLLLFSQTLYSQNKFKEDFLEFWTDINDNYAYLEKQGINWEKVKEIYSPVADTIHTKDEFISFLEKVINELHNGHISLNTNLNSSNKIIPSGSDLFVQKKNNNFFITDIRKNYPAELCGLRPGLQLIRFNGIKIDSLIIHFLPEYTDTYNDGMIEYALNMLFAGTHDKKRVITVLENGIEKDYFPDVFKEPDPLKDPLQFKILTNRTGYIKINNSLFNNELIPAFDSAVNSLQNTSRLIIDLTETPSGGNSAVARAIMGRFISQEMPFQKHELDETRYKIKRSWIEYVVPREPIYKKDVIIMVGHWTGSMGEGIAIGFDGMGRARIIGTKMAGLLGATDGFTLSNTDISFQIPTERLYHVNGKPREDFKPGYLSDNIYSTWKIVNEICNTEEKPEPEKR